MWREHMNLIHQLVLAVSNFLYQPFIVPLLLVGAGIYFSIRTGFLQLRLFPEILRVTLEKPENDKGISSFGALMVSTASRVGTGNIVGVSTAICLGGPGAVFWMWVTAVLGAASAFVESTLAQIYKRHDPENGQSYGGPSYYIETALKQRWLGILFAVFVLLTYVIGYNLLAAYNIQTSMEVFGFYNKVSTPLICGGVLCALFVVSVFGGAKQLTKITGILVPVMGCLYVLVAVFVLVMNAKNIPAMFYGIFTDAFTLKAGLGGLSGSCIMYGIKRGLYSNEAGMGSAPNASATASVSHPAKQGLVQVLSVFLDTLLICSATSFMCLSSSIVPSEELSGVLYVQECLRTVLGKGGPIFIAVSISLFGFTTLIGNYYYTEGCLRFILGRRPGKGFMTVFRIFAAGIVFVGALASAGFVWDMADLCQALMVVVNVPCILILSPKAIRCLKDYTEQRKKGKEPKYQAKACGITEQTDYWK